ncbi:MAG: NADH-quinone oxidoreductase subunit NuoE [Rhodospirillaceae bacterium]|nr:NADH-quinone oxidoreductase subunit NuoE [Rhodospirillaceae bacterium]|tara:strand:- start:11730 stop:12341 length:612 start_codon:yes stop_codon:yes gene_type:complete
MSLARGRPTALDQQPESFAFSAENAEKAQAIIAKYPEGRQQSAVMPLLDLAQRQETWVSIAAMDLISDMLDMPAIRVYEVATFYTMYNLEPVGEFLIQVCTTTPCMLRDSDSIVEACRSHLGIDFEETTEDGKFTMMEVECLGACVNAPMVQINDDFYEDLDAEKMLNILDALKRGEKPAIGSQNGRHTSEPASGAKTLQGGA